MDKKEVEIVSEKLKANIELVKDMGFDKIALNDYYTSVMKIVEDLANESK